MTQPPDPGYGFEYRNCVDCDRWVLFRAWHGSERGGEVVPLVERVVRCEKCWRVHTGTTYEGLPVGKIAPVPHMLPPLQSPQA